MRGRSLTGNQASLAFLGLAWRGPAVPLITCD